MSEYNQKRKFTQRICDLIDTHGSKVFINSEGKMTCGFIEKINDQVNSRISETNKDKEVTSFMSDFFLFGIEFDQLCSRSDVQNAIALTSKQIAQNMSEENRKYVNNPSRTVEKQESYKTKKV